MNSLYIKFLHESELICFHTVKWFQVLQSIGIMVRVFANSLRDQVSIPGHHTKDS